MSALLHVLSLFGAVALMVWGVELIIRPLSDLGRRSGLSPFIVGGTFVALGTNAPEVAVSIFYVLTGQGEAIFAHLVGTNLFNVLVVLGIGTFLGSLLVEERVIRTQLPLLLLSWALVYPLVLDFDLERLDGAALVVLGLFNIFFLWGQRRVSKVPSVRKSLGSNVRTAGKILTGTLLVSGGAWLLVVASGQLEGLLLDIAGTISGGRSVLAVSLVAVATSAPELLATGLATLRGEKELAVGTIVGSGIYNATFGFGFAAWLLPVRVPQSFLTGEAPFVLAASLACLGLLHLRSPVDRLVGLYFLFAYIMFVTWVAAQALGWGRTSVPWSLAMSCGVAVLLPLLLPRRYVQSYGLLRGVTREFEESQDR